METGTCRYRQRIRLPAALYAVPGAVCSITVATKDRLAVLADPVLAESLAARGAELAQAFSWDVRAAAIARLVAAVMTPGDRPVPTV